MYHQFHSAVVSVLGFGFALLQHNGGTVLMKRIGICFWRASCFMCVIRKRNIVERQNTQLLWLLSRVGIRNDRFLSLIEEDQLSGLLVQRTQQEWTYWDLWKKTFSTQDYKECQQTKELHVLRHVQKCPCPIWAVSSIAVIAVVTKIWEISGSQGGEYEDDCLLGCCAV
jgi:hypothetical protein